MPLPPPPGLRQTPSSLPPRPPPSSNTAQPPANPVGHGRSRPTGYSAFTAFQPRAVASSQPRANRHPVSNPPVSAGYATPANSYVNHYQQPQSYQGAPSYYGQPQYAENTYGPAVPQIANPFGPTPTQTNTGFPQNANAPGFDAETEAQIAQWQSAYNKPTEDSATKHQGNQSGSGVNTGAGTPTVGTGTPTPQAESKKTVIRSGGGQTWTDPTLLEWDPAHFRLFVGNLAGEVTDESLLKAFSRYTSVQKARVIREKRTQKSKGYGFISFSLGDEYFRAAREMHGKYIGSHPILLRKSETEVRPALDPKLGNKQGKGKGPKGGNAGAGGAGKVKHDGIKKSAKTKGGLKILG
ncbi:Nucleotide-binding alpha-beta plait [Penicillium cf. griseofulvum]|uniref:Nucleotide-binding alpha-beta plait n=1 Tax=Penicillium cf. griseofulvum TaxID=2972120 RepID=A0A9W9J282_9EURO|nr:Nucleotide-binding alpha-beta plait [Penicillium cf. griseofulvum]KAJ5435017.1 Nucleotide-binding alpha-beta plait [Penicillium cf. griseofulvum]KAJ5452851.1 Nucleotide-binding alpha-beta plait [Penicillium cf. griseofulvum]